MSNDWWSKKLGVQQPAHVPGIVLPPHQPVYHQQPQPVQPQQQYVQHPVQQQPPQDLGLQSYQQVAREHDGEKISHFWKGGEGLRREGHMACPQCGSSTGYTEYSSTLMHGSRPGPHCFECGYNGRFQQGLQANWV